MDHIREFILDGDRTYMFEAEYNFIRLYNRVKTFKDISMLKSNDGEYLPELERAFYAIDDWAEESVERKANKKVKKSGHESDYVKEA